MNALIDLLRQKSREIAPDYPHIEKDLEPEEHLWAITASCEGIQKANKDLHEVIAFMREQLGWNLEEYYKKIEENKVCHPYKE